MDVLAIVGSLWEYGALVVILFVANVLQWRENKSLTRILIDLTKDYAESITELKDLIKGDHHDE